MKRTLKNELIPILSSLKIANKSLKHLCVLQKVKKFLAKSGKIKCCFPNDEQRKSGQNFLNLNKNQSFILLKRKVFKTLK